MLLLHHFLVIYMYTSIHTSSAPTPSSLGTLGTSLGTSPDTRVCSCMCVCVFMCVCECVCVCVCERERESVCSAKAEQRENV